MSRTAPAGSADPAGTPADGGGPGLRFTADAFTADAFTADDLTADAFTADAAGGGAASAAPGQARDTVTEPRPVPEPGSLAQEAALLAAAVRDWLGAHGAPSSPGEGASASAGPAASDRFTPAEPVGAGGQATADDAPGTFDAPRAPADWDGPTAGTRAGPPWTVAPGATLCTGCPLCRLLASVSGSHAEVVEHLLAAVGSLAAAARAARPPARAPRAPPAPAAAPPPEPAPQTAPPA
ncbi:hypothetical protein I6A81_39960, partial [Frankia sp. CN7]|uniref:hypothetical protein n=1 Tax=Frankia nepalensis TaxID=1836974 RepID=UPI001933C93B